MGEADGFTDRRRGAVPSSQQGSKHGMVKDSKRNGMADRKEGAEPSSRQLEGVVPQMKRMYRRVKRKERTTETQNQTETQNPIETNNPELTNECSDGGEGEEKLGAVLSCRKQLGVVPRDERRKRKMNDAADREEEMERKKVSLQLNI